MGCYQKKERKQHLELLTMQREHRLRRAFFNFPALLSRQFPSKAILFSIGNWKLALVKRHELVMRKFETAARK